MPICAADVQFLRRLTAGMQAGNLVSHHHSRQRAGQALVLRFQGPASQRVARNFTRFDWGKPPLELIARLEADSDDDAPSSLCVMVIKRAEIARDQWSGQVTFPGGRRAREDDDDKAVAIREARAELGVPLDAGEFVYLGRLRDYELLQGEVGDKLVISRFVFLHIGEMTPTITLARHSVLGLQWVPISMLTRRNLRFTHVRHQLSALFLDGGTTDRHVYAQHVARDSGMSTVELQFPSVPLPQAWSLWGSALSGVSELVVLGTGRSSEALDWPRFRSGNRQVQCVLVDAWHGYHELFDDPPRPWNPRHIWWFAFDVFTCIAAITVVTCAVCEVVSAMNAELRYSLELEGRPVNTDLAHFQRRGEWRMDTGTLWAARGLGVREAKGSSSTTQDAEEQSSGERHQALDKEVIAPLNPAAVSNLAAAADAISPGNTGDASDEKDSEGEGPALPSSWEDADAYAQELQHGGTYIDPAALPLVADGGTVVVTPEEERAIKAKYGLE